MTKSAKEKKKSDNNQRVVVRDREKRHSAVSNEPVKLSGIPQQMPRNFTYIIVGNDQFSSTMILHPEVAALGKEKGGDQPWVLSPAHDLQYLLSTRNDPYKEVNEQITQQAKWSILKNPGLIGMADNLDSKTKSVKRADYDLAVSRAREQLKKDKEQYENLQKANFCAVKAEPLESSFSSTKDFKDAYAKWISEMRKWKGYKPYQGSIDDLLKDHYEDLRNFFREVHKSPKFPEYLKSQGYVEASPEYLRGSRQLPLESLAGCKNSSDVSAIVSKSIIALLQGGYTLPLPDILNEITRLVDDSDSEEQIRSKLLILISKICPYFTEGGDTAKQKAKERTSRRYGSKLTSVAKKLGFARGSASPSTS
jgi:hypothetical protein